MLTVAKVEALLKARFDHVFGKVPIINGFNEHMWTEGGEWPIFKKVKKFTQTRRTLFEWPKGVRSFPNCDSAVPYVLSEMKTKDVVGISMDCGTGKSTEFVVKLFNKGSYSNIVCIEPSFIVADELVKYVSENFSTVMIKRNYTPNERAICYLSAADFLKSLHDRTNFDSSLIVIDECHITNAVYAAMVSLLNYTSATILCMTASSSKGRVTRERVNVLEYTCSDNRFVNLAQEVSAGKSKGKSLIVGVIEAGFAVAKAANHITGITLDIDNVLDAGTRLDPTYTDNGLVNTFRAVTSLEMTQTLGRLGRVQGTAGSFHCVVNATEFKLDGKAKLYTEVHGAILSAFGHKSNWNATKVSNILSCTSVKDPNFESGSAKAHSKSNYDKHSISSSTGTKSSLRSQMSAVSSPKEDEVQVLTAARSGYMVDNKPNSICKDIFTVRASAWTAYAPNVGPSTLHRHIQQSNSMQEAVTSMRSRYNNISGIDINDDDRMSEIQLQEVNDIMSGNAFATYSEEELILVMKAWSFHVKLHSSLGANVALEAKVRKYIEAHNICWKNKSASNDKR